MTPDYSSSPIASLFPRIEQAPYDAVPERADELRLLAQKHGIVLVFEPDREDFHVSIDMNNRILFGVPVLERLWAYSYAYVHLLVVVQEQRGGVDFDLTSDPRSRPAMQLLSWAHDCERKEQHAPWPADMPKPDLAAPVGSIQKRVTEVFLNMVAWLMLHEFGHVVLGHLDGVARDDKDRYHKEEFQADDWAAEWMLHQRGNLSSEYDRTFINRALGATIVLSIYSSWEVHERHGESHTHPDPPVRLLCFLDKFAPETSQVRATMRELPWQMAGVIMQLHLTEDQRELLAPYDSFRGFYLDIMKALDPSMAHQIDELYHQPGTDLTATEHSRAQKLAYFHSLERGGGSEPPYNFDLAVADFCRAAGQVKAERCWKRFLSKPNWSRAASLCDKEIALAKSSRSMWGQVNRRGQNEAKANEEHDEFLARELVFERIAGICRTMDSAVIADRIRQVVNTTNLATLGFRKSDDISRHWNAAYEYALDQCQIRAHI